MKAAFPEIERIKYEGPAVQEPARLPPLQRRRKGRRQDDAATTCGSASSTGTPSAAPAPTRSAPAAPSARGKTAPTRSRTPRTALAWRSSSWRSSAPRSTRSTIATSPPKARTLAETNANLDAVVKVLKEEQQRTGIKLLWGTANLFSNRRYMHGAATSPNAEAFAFAAAQVKKALEVTKELGGDGYTFWGGREGYHNLWNTNMKRELDHLAKFLHMAVDYAKEIGFTGQFYIEPKPKEPTKHQYDSDAAACAQLPPRVRPASITSS